METPTRERIVAAARELFYENGYEATSLKRVAEAAGVHGGSLYHFFPSKTDLVEAVLEEYLEFLDPVLMAPVREATDDPVERVMRLLDGYRNHLLETEFRGGCPIGALALELSDRQPRARALVNENFEAWRRAVAKMLQEADPPEDVDTSEIASLALTIMEGGVMQAKSERTIEPFDACVRQFRRYLEGSLEGTWTRA